MFGFSEGLVSSSDGTEFGSHQHLWEHLFPSQAQINHTLSLSLSDNGDAIGPSCKKADSKGDK
jgi:hypothetical protein